MHDLPFTYLAATYHLWHYAWTCEWMIMALKQGKHKINPNSTCDSKQANKHVKHRHWKHKNMGKEAKQNEHVKVVMKQTK